MSAPIILNLGCGTKTSSACQNLDWSPYLRLKKNVVGRRAALALRGERRERFESLSENVVVHDLRRGLPWPDASVDAVYSSHVLEHIDRDQAGGFLAESLRVLRPGGVIRVVVPDFERLAQDYLESLGALRSLERSPTQHEQSIADLVEQMVRRDPSALKGRRPVARRVERLILGDARRRGETHQWMYDGPTLVALLGEVGFKETVVGDYRTSRIPNWNEIGLDLISDGREYKPRSLYVEGVRP